MTPHESRSLHRGAALLLVLSLVRCGVGHLRSLGTDSGTAGEDDLAHLLEESRNVKEEEERRSLPLAPGERLDPNRSSEEELDRLPGIGPATAQAWVGERTVHGGFRLPEDLLRVKGIGPATLAKIRNHLDFSQGVPAEMVRRPRASSSFEPAGERLSSPSGGGEAPSLLSPRIDLNRAGAEELQSLPGIGPSLSERIVEDRRERGRFRTVDELLRVRGIGPAVLAEIRSSVSVGG